MRQEPFLIDGLSVDRWLSICERRRRARRRYLLISRIGRGAVFLAAAAGFCAWLYRIFLAFGTRH